ncbi:MAG: LamG-like jellyroll fold domain-containing protein [bacterium]|nr:LamG-like jellyroll fold domain-containing protein [bacterium]
MSRSSFTLIELLVVIAILAILSVAAVLLINPADIIRQSRDTNRLTDLNNLNKALSIFGITNPGDFTGTSTVIYVSVPDTTTNCANLGLPALPGSYTYQCVTSSTLTKVDGTGWIPVNFLNISHGSPLNKLPVDPVNTTSTGEYYTYIMGGSWELNAVLTSEKYRKDDDVIKSNMPGVLSIGTHKNLSPVYTTNGLVAFYKFNNGSGVTLTDSIGGYTGTITAGTGGWTTDNKGNRKAYDFDGANTKVATTLTSNTNFVSGFTASVWIKPDSIGEGSNPGDFGRIISKDANTVTTEFATNGFGIGINSPNSRYSFYVGSNSLSWPGNSLVLNVWQHLVVTVTSAGSAVVFKDGVQVNSGAVGVLSAITTSNPLVIGNRSAGTDKTFDGKIFDIRIYNRVLSLAEVRGIYNSTR